MFLSFFLPCANIYKNKANTDNSEISTVSTEIYNNELTIREINKIGNSFTYSLDVSVNSERNWNSTDLIKYEVDEKGTSSNFEYQGTFVYGNNMIDFTLSNLKEHTTYTVYLTNTTQDSEKITYVFTTFYFDIESNFYYVSPYEIYNDEFYVQMVLKNDFLMEYEVDTNVFNSVIYLPTMYYSTDNWVTQKQIGYGAVSASDPDGSNYCSADRCYKTHKIFETSSLTPIQEETTYNVQIKMDYAIVFNQNITTYSAEDYVNKTTFRNDNKYLFEYNDDGTSDMTLEFYTSPNTPKNFKLEYTMDDGKTWIEIDYIEVSEDRYQITFTNLVVGNVYEINYRIDGVVQKDDDTYYIKNPPVESNSIPIIWITIGSITAAIFLVIITYVIVNNVKKRKNKTTSN